MVCFFERKIDDDAAAASGEPSTPQFSNASEAAAAVSQELRNASYEETLNGWFEWFQRAQTEGLQTAALYDDVVRLGRSTCRAAFAAAVPNDRQLARLQYGSSSSSLTPPDKDHHDHEELWNLLEQLLPIGPHTSQPESLANRLHRFVEDDSGGKHAYFFNRIDPSSGQFTEETTGKGEKGLAKLLRRLRECAADGIRAVTLSLRVKEGCKLHEACRARLDRRYSMSRTICPAERWCEGPPNNPAEIESEADEPTLVRRLPRSGDEGDPRYYLIIGTPGALTKSHWDRGVQSVLYHTVAGTNHAVSVPRRVALALNAVDPANEDDEPSPESSAWHNRLECATLEACGEHVRSATFASGETMLILPGGGHAILTGVEGKVVLAGEWHLRTDVRLARERVGRSGRLHGEMKSSTRMKKH